MALTDEGGMNTTMLVSPTGAGVMNAPYPVYYPNGNGNNNGGFGGDWGWIILLLLLGWGNNGNGGFGGFGGFGGNYDFPWLLTGQQNINTNTNNGFRDQMLNDNITSVRDGIYSLSNQLCSCCSDMQMAMANGFAGVEQSANARQIANMQTAFATQTAMNQGFNNVQTQLANCCCENRAGIADLKYTVATENCADRQALNEGVRDIITNQTAGVQRILDKLCDSELQAERRENANLRQELLYARGQASQDVQTARILAGQVAETDAIYNRLNECPVGTVPVYGRQPIFTCPQNNNGCGCGCGNGF